MDEAAAAAAAGDAGEDPAAAAGKRKKQKLAGGAGAAASAQLQLQPTAALPGHVHCVAAVAWPSRDAVFSGGWDHSVRRYDVEARTNTDTYNGSKAVYAVAAPAAADGAGGSSSDVVAFGGSDRVLRIWDTRGVAGEGLAIKAHNAHEGWISALAWRPGSGHQLASGGHDGALKLWDIRTPVALAAMSQHEEGAKVLDVAWAGAGTLLSGGSDCTLQVYTMA
jgi:ribosome biogenesis protein YTM1